MKEDFKRKSAPPVSEREQKILQEGKKRFRRCEEWESEARRRYKKDVMFANADSENGWQWPDEILRNREIENKPCVTINKVRQHNLQIINDAKQNKPGVSIKPTGGGATAKSAQIFGGIVRHIEYISSAEQVYDWATTTQVQGGVGYWRLVTDYAGEDSFDQEIFIRRIVDPLSVYIDPDCKEVDTSDKNFGFIFEDVNRDDFATQYPQFINEVGDCILGHGDNWASKDYVRIAEYYRRVPKKDKLIAFAHPETGEQIIERKSNLSKEMLQIIGQQDGVQSRDISTYGVEWFKIAGDRIVDESPWLGIYVPIVRIIGEEVIVDGKLDRKGHTRSMLDPQRMYNYWSASSIEFGALQTKVPYIGGARAIEGYESYWENANTQNFSVLVYNDTDDQGNALSAPRRSEPPITPPMYVQGMMTAQNELMMASGQYQSQFGQNENATSGKAINERQRQGDNATYHFIDNLAIGIKFTGKMLIDLIPKIYDTPRIIRIMAQDGTESQIAVDPSSPQASLQLTPENKQQFHGNDLTQEVNAIFNPNVGKYEVISDVGPAYATRRQEAFNAFTQIARENPQFMQIAGDLMWRAADFPMAAELAERWRRIIPPNILGEDGALPPQIEQAMNAASQEIEKLHGVIASLQDQLKDKEADLNLRAYDSESRRITAVSNAPPQISEEILAPVVASILQQMLSQEDPLSSPRNKEEYSEMVSSGLANQQTLQPQEQLDQVPPQ